MSRYIDADALLKGHEDHELISTHLIWNAPTADVVEIVRCKNCKHHEELLYNNDGKVLCWVHDLDVVVDGNGYCNYGERKEQKHE